MTSPAWQSCARLRRVEGWRSGDSGRGGRAARRAGKTAPPVSAASRWRTALTLAAGQGLYIALFQLGEADGLPGRRVQISVSRFDSQSQRPRCGWRPVSAVSRTVEAKASLCRCASQPRRFAAACVGRVRRRFRHRADLARISGAQPGEHREQRRLAGPVAAEDGQPFSCSKGEIQVAADDVTADADGEIVGFKQGRSLPMPRQQNKRPGRRSARSARRPVTAVAQ